MLSNSHLKILNKCNNKILNLEGEGERERERVRERVKKKKSVSVRQWVRENDIVRACLCIFLCVWERESLCMCFWLCVTENDRECEIVMERVWLLDCNNAVSYTHLDVYKRQVYVLFTPTEEDIYHVETFGEIKQSKFIVKFYIYK